MSDSFKWIVEDMVRADGVWWVTVRGREGWFRVGYKRLTRDEVKLRLRARGHEVVAG